MPFVAPTAFSFLLIWWKCPAKKAGNGISGTLNWKISWRSMLPDPLSNFSSRAYTLQIWLGDRPQSSSIFHYFPPSMKNKRQVRATASTMKKRPRRETATSLLIWWLGKGPTSLWVQKCKRTPTWLLVQKKKIHGLVLELMFMSKPLSICCGYDRLRTVSYFLSDSRSLEHELKGTRSPPIFSSFLPLNLRNFIFSLAARRS